VVVKGVVVEGRKVRVAWEPSPCALRYILIAHKIVRMDGRFSSLFLELLSLSFIIAYFTYIRHNRNRGQPVVLPSKLYMYQGYFNIIIKAGLRESSNCLGENWYRKILEFHLDPNIRIKKYC
jgi:hypothetical protein